MRIGCMLRARLFSALVGVLVALAVLPAMSYGACANPVACENALPGSPPSAWEVDGTGDSTIQGFATQMSVSPGDTIGFKVKSATANYHVDIFRVGYYGGNGARLIAGNLTPTNPATQPACLTFQST